MRPRAYLLLSLLIPLLGAMLTSSAQAAGPVLFLDSHDIAAQHGLRRVVHDPHRYPRPLVGPAQQNAGPWTTVLKTGGGYRLYYNRIIPGTAMYISYVDSRDGVRFSSTPTNLDIPNVDFGATIVRAPNGRLVLGWYQEGIWTAVSNDGGNRFRQETKVLNQIGPAGENDIVSMTRFHGRYLAYIKRYAPYARGGKLAPAHTRRVVTVSTSADAQHWTKPRIVIAPDSRDPGVTEFYGLGGIIQRGDLLIGMLRVLRDDQGRGTGYTTLAWSRDGVHWNRDRTPFMRRGATRWDTAMAWADSQIVVGNQTRVYYGGYTGGHKGNGKPKDNPYNHRRIGLASMPVDRYVSLSGTGTLVTRAMRVTRINARVRGSITLTAGGKTCHVGRGDYVYRRVCDLPAGRVRIRVRNADLYGLR